MSRDPNTGIINCKLTSLSSTKIRLMSKEEQSCKKLLALQRSKGKEEESHQDRIFLTKKVVRLGHSPKVVDVNFDEKEDPVTPFRRYKTEALKKYENKSLKNVFNRLSVDLGSKEDI